MKNKILKFNRKADLLISYSDFCIQQLPDTILPLNMAKTQISLKIIDLRGENFTYQLRKSWRNRYIRISIHPQKGLLVSSSKFVMQSQIDSFLKQKQDWIISKLKIKDHHEQQRFKFAPQALITLLGKDYQIIIEKTDHIRPSVKLTESNLIILLPLLKTSNRLHASLNQDGTVTDLNSIHSTDEKVAKHVFHTWLDRYTKQTITDRVEEYAQKFRLKFNRISIKNQQTVWGSCSSKKNLNFSKRLIQLPVWLIDYVICHELSHLTHPNHSSKFWGLVGNYYSNYKQARRYLKSYQPKIKLD